MKIKKEAKGASESSDSAFIQPNPRGWQTKIPRQKCVQIARSAFAPPPTSIRCEIRAAGETNEKNKKNKQTYFGKFQANTTRRNSRCPVQSETTRLPLLVVITRTSSLAEKKNSVKNKSNYNSRNRVRIRPRSCFILFSFFFFPNRRNNTICGV